jgi:hypothetical protein
MIYPCLCFEETEQSNYIKGINLHDKSNITIVPPD